MKALEEKIREEGKVLPGNILKVGNFLNHRLDVQFLCEMGKEIARLYEGCGINKILTIETSGIAIAMGAAIHMGVPVVFAKKNKSKNVSGEVYCTDVVSFTHKNVSQVIVEKQFLSEKDRVLLVDDFLANGMALKGLIGICREAGVDIAGAAIAIEKGFQAGGDEIRAMGIRVESLAIVESMTDDSITFREQ
ncbi:MAG: xanthine phosphoribosyltransferase [Ruminococcaceae bacterium]|nr:xanthine phosphoribosyltransferase [Oscillospiraceae bacterium]